MTSIPERNFINHYKFPINIVLRWFKSILLQIISMENIPTSINYNAKCKFQGNFIIERLYCIEKNMGILTTDFLPYVLNPLILLKLIQIMQKDVEININNGNSTLQ